MKKDKQTLKCKTVLGFFLFMLIFLFMLSSAMSRFDLFEYSDRALLLGPPIVAVFLTGVYYIYYKLTGSTAMFLSGWKSRSGKIYRVITGSFFLVWAGLSTLLRFDLISISDKVLWILSAVVPIITLTIYLTVTHSTTSYSR